MDEELLSQMLWGLLPLLPSNQKDRRFSPSPQLEGFESLPPHREVQCIYAEILMDL